MEFINMLIKPMEPVSYKEPFDNPEYLFELKWDGIRILTFSDRVNLRLQNRSLKDRTAKFPELHSIHKQIKAREVVLDGEAVVISQGKPNFHKVMERAMAGTDRSIRGMVKRIPVIYVVFDILYCDGKWLLELPLVERKQLLTELITTGPNLELSNPLEGNGINIFEAVCANELEGVVAKLNDSKYLIGKKDKRWLKIKRRIEQKCIILGFYSKGGCITSLIMGAYYKGRLIYVGRVASGLSGHLGSELYKALAPDIITVKGPELIKQHKAASWVEPNYVAEVEFMEWTEDRKMRMPVLRKVLWDADPGECEIQ